MMPEPTRVPLTFARRLRGSRIWAALPKPLAVALDDQEQSIKDSAVCEHGGDEVTDAMLRAAWDAQERADYVLMAALVKYFTDDLRTEIAGILSERTTP